MKFGIYYSYWEQEWSADCLRYVEKVARLGFDVIEIAAQHLNSYSPAHIAEVARAARDNGIAITAGLGPSPEKNLSSADPAIRKAGRAFFEETLGNLARLDIHVIGGALYSYWPIDYSKPVDKASDRARGLEGISSLADFAANLGVDLCLEVLNRFENHVLNTAEEGVAFVREVGKPNVKVMLDTFHMNIEEDSFGAAIRTAGPLLGHFHTGENNRRVPGKGRLPWHEIGAALREIGYGGAVVMEPFVKMGGRVGSDIKVWRDLSENADEAEDGRSGATSVGVLAIRARLEIPYVVMAGLDPAIHDFHSERPPRGILRRARVGGMDAAKTWMAGSSPADEDAPSPHPFGRCRASASSTAIRTATPISTCSRISDCAPSATSESISTPRFIGPGCMTNAPGLA